MCAQRAVLGVGWQDAQGTEWATDRLHGFLSSVARDQRSAQAAQPRAVHPHQWSGHVRPEPKALQHSIVFQSQPCAGPNKSSPELVILQNFDHLLRGQFPSSGFFGPHLEDKLSDA